MYVNFYNIAAEYELPSHAVAYDKHGKTTPKYFNNRVLECYRYLPQVITLFDSEHCHPL